MEGGLSRRRSPLRRPRRQLAAGVVFLQAVAAEGIDREPAHDMRDVDITRFSTILPSLTLRKSMSRISTRLPVGGIPMNSPEWTDRALVTRVMMKGGRETRMFCRRGPWTMLPTASAIATGARWSLSRAACDHEPLRCARPVPDEDARDDRPGDGDEGRRGARRPVLIGAGTPGVPCAVSIRRYVRRSA